MYERGETKIVYRLFSHTQLINLHELKLHDMQGNEKCVKYQSMNDSEAESIKDVDNMIAPPTRCTHLGLMIRFNTTFSDNIYIGRFHHLVLMEIKYCEYAPD